MCLNIRAHICARCDAFTQAPTCVYLCRYRGGDGRPDSEAAMPIDRRSSGVSASPGSSPASSLYAPPPPQPRSNGPHVHWAATPRSTLSSNSSLSSQRAMMTPQTDQSPMMTSELGPPEDRRIGSRQSPRSTAYQPFPRDTGSRPSPGNLDDMGYRQSPNGMGAGMPSSNPGAGSPSSVDRSVTRPQQPRQATFSPSRGAFGGKTITQPPGGHTSLNIFG